MTEEDPDWVISFKLIEDWEQHTIDHLPYINAILHWFNMAKCDLVDTPMVPNKTLSKFDFHTNNDDKQIMSEHPYQELIAALVWLSITSCPNILFTATHIAKFNSNLGDAHWQAAKCVLCYLKGNSR